MSFVASLALLVSVEAAAPAATPARPPGTLRFTTSRPLSLPVWIVLLPLSPLGGEVLEERRWDPPGPAQRVATPALSFDAVFSPGTYAVAVDRGMERAPVIFRRVEIESGKTIRLDLADAPSRSLSVIVRDRATKKPLPGAGIAFGVPLSADERVLLALLHRRAPKTGTNGLLNLGALSRDELFLSIEAKEHRRATLKVPAESEDGTREVALPPFQSIDVAVTGLALKKDEPRPVLALGACGKGKAGPCDTGRWKEEDFRRTPLSDDLRGFFKSVAPGDYRVFLESNGHRAASRFTEVSNRAEDPDVVSVELPLRERVFRGRVRFKDGRGADATVSAGTASNGKSRGDSDDLGKTQTSPDGTFELKVSALQEHVVLLRARSEDPKGEGGWMKRGPGMFFPLDLEEGIEITLMTGALKVTLKDRKTEKPIPECFVSAQWTAREKASGGKGVILHSDGEGTVSMDGIDAGWIRIVPRCNGYAATEGFEFHLESEEGRNEDVLLDRTGDFLLRVSDQSGAPVPGARVSGFDVANAGSGNGEGRFANPAVPIGQTDGSGELTASGDRWAGVPFFVVGPAPSYAILIGRFPAPRSCDDPSDCTVAAVLVPRSPFPGLLVKVPPDAPVLRSLISFSSGDIPIPPDVVAEAALLSGLDTPTENGNVLFLLSPAVLPDGVYTVRLMYWNPQKKKPGRFVVAGSFAVPADRLIELAAPGAP